MVDPRRRALLLAAALLLLAPPALAGEFLNLDFELAAGPGQARGWFQGGESTEAVVDSTVAHSGERSLRLRRLGGGGFGVATATFPALDAAGKRLTYSGWIRTENVTEGQAVLWLRVAGRDSVLAFENMEGEGATGTSPWTRYEIELDVDPDAGNVTFGALLPGNGTAWFDALAFEVDGVPYEQIAPAVFVPSPEEIEWIRANATAFRTEDPEAGREGLETIGTIAGPARIVALGEATHGTREFFRMKDRIVRVLVEELGFSLFAIEANLPEAARVNEYVLTGAGDPREALAGMYLWAWSTEEMLELVEWMREYNASGKGRIEFWGFDVQYPHRSMEIVEAFVERAETKYAERIPRAYDRVREAWELLKTETGARAATIAAGWQQAAHSVVSNLELNRDHYLQTIDAHEVEWVIRNARLVLQSAEARVRGGKTRIESMAENVSWILEQAPPGARMIVWAHNARVSKSARPFPTLGSLLREEHPDLVSIAFAFQRGEYTARGDDGIGPYGTAPAGPGSAEWALHRAGLPRLILDLRAALRSPQGLWLGRELDFRAIFATPRDWAFNPVVLTDHFDALVYFEESHPTRVLETPRPVPGE